MFREDGTDGKDGQTEDSLFEASGGYESDCLLTSLFYDLLRDWIPPGKLHHLVMAATCHDKRIKYTNGWLARYANYLASQFRPTNVNTNVDG